MTTTYIAKHVDYMSLSAYRRAWAPAVLGGFFKGLGYSFATFNFWSLCVLRQLDSGFLSQDLIRQMAAEHPYFLAFFAMMFVAMTLCTMRISIGMEGQGLFLRLAAKHFFAKLLNPPDHYARYVQQPEQPDQASSFAKSTPPLPGHRYLFTVILSIMIPGLCAFAKGTAAGFGVWCALNLLAGPSPSEMGIAIVFGVGIFAISAFKEGRRYYRALLKRSARSLVARPGDLAYVDFTQHDRPSPFTNPQSSVKHTQRRFHHLRHCFGLMLALFGALAKGFSDNWGAFGGIGFYVFGVDKASLIQNPYIHFAILLCIPSIVVVSLAMEGKGTVKAFAPGASNIPRVVVMALIAVICGAWAVMSLPISLSMRLGLGMPALLALITLALIARQYTQPAVGAWSAAFAFLIKGGNMAFGTAAICHLAGAPIWATAIMMSISGLMTGLLTAKEGSATIRWVTGWQSQPCRFVDLGAQMPIKSSQLMPTLRSSIEHGSSEGQSDQFLIEYLDRAELDERAVDESQFMAGTMAH